MRNNNTHKKVKEECWFGFQPQHNNVFQVALVPLLSSIFSCCLGKAKSLLYLQDSAKHSCQDLGDASAKPLWKKYCLSERHTITHIGDKKLLTAILSYQRGKISRWWAASGQQSRTCSRGSEPAGRPVGGRWVGRRGPLDPRGARAEWEGRTRAGGCQAWRDTPPCWILALPGCGGCYCAPGGRRQGGRDARQILWPRTDLN